jgi:hypothetical protein
MWNHFVWQVRAESDVAVRILVFIDRETHGVGPRFLVRP